MERKLASIQVIESLAPIPGADSIEVAKVLGWNVVVKKGEFQPGDKVIYCEIDSLLPERPEFEFLRPKHFRIKTIKLRGQVSQGICFPLNILPQADAHISDDVSEVLGITKYEKPIPVALKGRIRGNFPSGIPKTDEMRIQAVPGVLERNRGKELYISEKLDGTSMTAFIDPETGLHVCSRNLDLAPDFEHKFNGTAYWTYAEKHNLEGIIKDLGYVALQGELIGPGIQENKYGLKDLQFRVFNIYDIANHQYFEYLDMLAAVEAFGLGDSFLVPMLGDIKLDHSVEEILEMSKGKSVLRDTPREGIVLRTTGSETDPELGRLSFKAINSDFLLKHGE